MNCYFILCILYYLYTNVFVTCRKCYGILCFQCCTCVIIVINFNPKFHLHMIYKCILILDIIINILVSNCLHKSCTRGNVFEEAPVANITKVIEIPYKEIKIQMDLDMVNVDVNYII